MSYKVLARKYRPQQFDEVIAQEHVTRTLKNALTSGRISSGYLFTGPRGTGKTTTARILAKALNCVQGPTPTPCDKCPACLEIISGSALDVLEIDAASNTGVDDIRTLRENVRYLPTTGKRRIYIIDEVHRLSGSAFDALLKTLEEPPAHVVFILATTEPHKVPETIRSRSQRHDFHRVTVEILKKHLQKLAEAEKIGIDEEALYILARKADGSVRDAVSLLDQISAFTDQTITAVHVNEALGLIDRTFFLDYFAALAARDTGASLALVKKIFDSGLEAAEFCSGLGDHCRALMILINAKEPRTLMELSDSEWESFAKQKDFFSTGDLLRFTKIITDSSLQIKNGMDARLMLETMSLRMATLDTTVTFEQILAHLTEHQSLPEMPSAPAKATDLFGKPETSPAPAKVTITRPAASESIPAPVEDISIGAGLAGIGRPLNLPLVQTGWHKFIDSLKVKNQMLAAHLSMVEIREVKDNTITAVFHNAGGTSKQVVEKPDYITIITSHLRDFFKTNVKIRFEIDANKKLTVENKPEPKIEKVDSQKILEENGQLKKLVEKFDGEIIGVREKEES